MVSPVALRLDRPTPVTVRDAPRKSLILRAATAHETLGMQQNAKGRFSRESLSNKTVLRCSLKVGLLCRSQSGSGLHKSPQLLLVEYLLLLKFLRSIFPRIVIVCVQLIGRDERLNRRLVCRRCRNVLRVCSCFEHEIMMLCTQLFTIGRRHRG